jgi:hypothetical protein
MVAQSPAGHRILTVHADGRITEDHGRRTLNWTRIVLAAALVIGLAAGGLAVARASSTPRDGDDANMGTEPGMSAGPSELSKTEATQRNSPVAPQAESSPAGDHGPPAGSQAMPGPPAMPAPRTAVTAPAEAQTAPPDAAPVTPAASAPSAIGSIPPAGIEASSDPETPSGASASPSEADPSAPPAEQAQKRSKKPNTKTPAAKESRRKAAQPAPAPPRQPGGGFVLWQDE